MGRPKQAVDVEASADAGGALLEVFGAAIVKAYGERDTGDHPDTDHPETDSAAPGG